MKKLLREAEGIFPGGVNSPVRAFLAVGGSPPFVIKGKGSHLWDAQGKEYIDYVCSWGPLILGHAQERVVDAVARAAREGLSFGAPTEREVHLGRLLKEAFPSMEMLRLVSSGTEAVMSAIRLARAFTGRERIVKFDGCYHGHADSLLVKAGSGLATFGTPDSKGVPASLAERTAVFPYNDLPAVSEGMERIGKEVACVILEPVAGNMGVVLPEEGFLSGLREICSTHGALLILDEVITGFRLCWGGAQKLFHVSPDLTCLGKIIGGGMPIGAYGGRAEVMRLVAPLGPVYQAGTLSGNPLSCSAGIETLLLLREKGLYPRLDSLAALLEKGLSEEARKLGLPLTVNRLGSMLTPFFTEGPVRDYASAKKSDTRRFAAFFKEMLRQGIYIPPSQFEAWFVSIAHTENDIEKSIAAARLSFLSLK